MDFVADLPRRALMNPSDLCLEIRNGLGVMFAGGCTWWRFAWMLKPV